MITIVIYKPENLRYKVVALEACNAMQDRFELAAFGSKASAAARKDTRWIKAISKGED